jgi:hypothetical protein
MVVSTYENDIEICYLTSIIDRKRTRPYKHAKMDYYLEGRGGGATS